MQRTTSFQALYDAYFLQVAQTLSSPLLTLDTRLKAVAQNMSIKTLE